MRQAGRVGERQLGRTATAELESRAHRRRCSNRNFLLQTLASQPVCMLPTQRTVGREAQGRGCQATCLQATSVATPASAHASHHR